MLAILALGSPSNKQSSALMACPAHPLGRVLARQLLSSSTVRHCQGVGTLLSTIVNSDASNGLSFALQILSSLARVSWAFLAAGVLAIAADPFCSKQSLAAMAGTVDPHANLLLHSRYTICVRHSPFTRLQSQSVLGEHSACLLLLDSAVFLRSHADAWLDGCGRRLIVLYDLGYLSGDRQSWGRVTFGGSGCCSGSAALILVKIR